jgi:hypothetical protein
MVVRCPNHHRSGCNATALLNLLPRCLNHSSWDHDRVCANQRHSGLAIIKNHCPHFARIVKSGQIGGEVVSGIFHANVGSNVALGKTGLQELLITGQFHLSEILRNKRGRVERRGDGRCCGLSASNSLDAESQSRYGVLFEEVSSVHVFLSGNAGAGDFPAKVFSWLAGHATQLLIPHLVFCG